MSPPTPDSIRVKQRRVNEILRWGIVFSLLWLAGIGSAIAIFQGYRAERLIKESNGALRGLHRVSWCYYVGAFGVLVWGTVLVVGILNR